LIYIGLLIFSSFLSIPLYIYLSPQFGGKITDDVVKKCQSSIHFNGKIFRNFQRTGVDMSLKTLPRFLKDQFSNREIRRPAQPIPIPLENLEKFSSLDGKSKFIWFGHSVFLFSIEGKNYLVDPMFGDDVTPIAPTRSKRYSNDTIQIIEKLPAIDAIFITHDHYDHLDYVSIKRLKEKVRSFIVPLGVGRHLIRWGVPSNNIKEMDWWETMNDGMVDIVFTPSRHYGGRGIADRAKSLWGGWIFKSINHNVYISGDGGFDPLFKEVGERYGPFDWMFVECGQYNELWKQIHMHPEESVQAVLDAKCKIAVPIHWGAFTLAMHSWKEPAERFVREADKRNVTYSLPKIGEWVNLDADPVTEKWFEKL
jgi:L-ascorbate metabolism protein UlaG (beta-lactamase superfamily)